MATSHIVDINGQPFRLPDLSEPQTLSDARIANLYQYYGGHPSGGLTPSRLAAIMSDAEQNDMIAQCELAEDMEEKDAHIQSELGKRRLAMQGPDWNIEPPPNASAAEKRDAEMIEELLRSATWLDEAIFDAGDAILKSFSAQELKWEFAENTHYIVDTEWRDASWFQPNPKDRNQLRLRDGSYEGAELRPFGWLSHQAKAKSGYLSRRGLVRVLAWPFLFKNYSVRDLAEFLEIYGLPLRLGKYPEGASEREKSTLLRAVMSIGHNAGGIIPKGMEIDFQDAADGASDPFMAMVNWCERSQSKAILGGTLTSQADGKSSTNALGNVHNEVRKEIRDADCKALANTLTRDIVYPLYVLNGRSYQSPRRIPRFVFDLHEPEDLTQFTAPLDTLTRLGMPIPQSWVYEKTRIPRPNGNEPVLTLPQTNAPGAVQLAALKADGVHHFKDQDEIEAALDQLSNGALNEQMYTLLKPIVEAAGQGPQAVKTLLDQIWPDMNDGALQEKLAQVMFVAALWGDAHA